MIQPRTHWSMIQLSSSSWKNSCCCYFQSWLLLQQQQERERQLQNGKLSSYNLVVSDGDNEGKDVAAAVAVVVINNANNVIVNDAVSNGGSAQASGPHTSSMKSKADPNGEVINSDAIEMCK